MGNIKKRGILTPEIVELGKELLGEELTTRALRLLPFIQYTIMNSKIMDQRSINSEERDTIGSWTQKGFISFHNNKLKVSREFYDAMNEILWQSYVDID